MGERTLLDSGIFLEVLLEQQRAVLCKSILEQHQQQLIVTDFALHAIGLVLLRYKRPDLYRQFFNDLAPRLEVLTLPAQSYFSILDYHEQFGLDFDDAYQFAAASFFGLSLTTLDSDFSKMTGVEIVLIR